MPKLPPKLPPRLPPEELPEADADLISDEDVYDAPPELGESGGGDRGAPPARPPSSAALKLAAVIAVVLLAGAALYAYRAYHRHKVLAEGFAKADALLRLDTAAGYRQAASLLDPLAQMDPSEAASVRAFALAMLFADYRAQELETEIDTLLVVPSREETVPAYAQLAMAALALGRHEAGNAATSAARAGAGALARTLQARIAFFAGSPDAALEPAASAAAEGAFPAGLAIQGDALRRLHKDQGSARAAYEAALAASPNHPRAAYGLAKLALAGQAPAVGAVAALQRLLADTAGTPSQERGRAALHLAALRLRSANRAGAEAALTAAGLDAPARAWAFRAALLESENRGPYRAVSGAPAALQSASDDDPGELSPTPPPPPPAQDTVKAPPRATKQGSKHPAAKKTAKATKKSAAKKKPASR